MDPLINSTLSAQNMRTPLRTLHLYLSKAMRFLPTVSLVIVMVACTGEDDPTSGCTKIWNVETTSNGQASVSGGALRLSANNPSVKNEVRVWQAATQYSDTAPGSLNYEIAFEEFIAGGNLSHDGYFSATVAYEKDPATPIFKVTLWENAVEMWAGSNYYSRDISSRQARGNIRFRYGHASAEPKVGRVEYNPVNTTQQLHGSGEFSLANDPLILILEVGGSNFTPASEQVSIKLLHVSAQANLPEGDLQTDTFDCPSLK